MGFNIGDAFNKAKNKASNVIDTGSDKLRDAARLPGRVVHSAASTVRNELNDTKNLATKAKNSVVNTARREWNDTKNLTTKAKNSVVNTARREWNDTKNLTTKAKNSVVNTARREWNDTKNLTTKAKNSVVNTARREWNDTKNLTTKAKNSVVNTARREWNDTKSLTTKAKNSVVNTARREWDDGKRLVSKAKNSVVNTAHREWDDGRGFAVTTKNSLASAAQETKEFLVGNPEKMGDSNRNALKALITPDKSWKDRVKIVDQWWDKTQPNLGLFGHHVDFQIGAAKAIGAMGKGLYSLATNPVFNPTAMLYGVATNRAETMQKSEDTIKGMLSLAKNPAVQSLSPIGATINFSTRPQETTQAFRDLGSAFAKPYVDDWKSGHPGQAFGRGFVDFGSLFIPGGVGVAGKAGTAAKVTTETAEIASRAGTAARVASEGAEVTASRPPAQTKFSRTTPVTEPRLSEPAIKPSDARQGSTASRVTSPTGGGEGTSLRRSTDSSRPLGGRESNPRPLNRPDPVYGGTHSGSLSGRTFTPAESGGPIQNLSTERLKIQDNGIDAIKNHVARFGHDPQNAAQIQRLRQIATGKLKPTEADVNFYGHELRESVRYRKLGYKTGQPTDTDAADRLWNNAHTATLEDYGLKEGKGVLYHPSVEMGSEISKPLGARGPSDARQGSTPSSVSSPIGGGESAPVEYKGGGWRLPNGQYAKNPKLSPTPRRITGRYNNDFMQEQLQIILKGMDENGSHPLDMFVDPKTRNFYSRSPEGWSGVNKPGVQAMHMKSGHALKPDEPETLAFGEASQNWAEGLKERYGAEYMRKALEMPDGIIIEPGLAKYLEEIGRLEKGSVAKLPRVEGWVSPKWTPLKAEE